MVQNDHRDSLPILLDDGESQVSTENFPKIRLLLLQQPCLKVHISAGGQIEQHSFPDHHRGHAGDVPGVSVIHRNSQPQEYHGLGNECLVGVAEYADRNIGRARAGVAKIAGDRSDHPALLRGEAKDFRFVMT